MQLHALTVASLHTNPEDANGHTKESIEAIKASLVAYGQQKNIVVNKAGMVVAGNGTFMAAQELGWESIYAHVTELEGEALDGYAVADNKVAEYSEWRWSKLSDKMKGFSDQTRKTSGFRDFEIKPLVNAEWRPTAKAEKPNTPDQLTVVFKGSQIEIIRAAMDQARQETSNPKMKTADALSHVVGVILNS